MTTPATATAFGGCASVSPGRAAPLVPIVSLTPYDGTERDNEAILSPTRVARFVPLKAKGKRSVI